MNDNWLEDTTDVLHCSMPPQVRAHIEELRDEVARLQGQVAHDEARIGRFDDAVRQLQAEVTRLRAAEVPLSANVGFVGVGNYDEIVADGADNDTAWPSVHAMQADRPLAKLEHIVALIPVTAWDRT